MTSCYIASVAWRQDHTITTKLATCVYIPCLKRWSLGYWGAVRHELRNPQYLVVKVLKNKKFFGSCSARRSFLQNLEYSVLHSELVVHNIMALIALSLVHVYAIMFFVIWSSLISPTIGPDSKSSLPQSGPFCGEWWYHYTTCTAFSWVSPIAKHGSWSGIFRNKMELFRLILSCNPAFFILSYATPASAGRSEVKDGQDLQSTDPYPSVG